VSRFVLGALLLAAGAAASGPTGVRIVEDAGKWESGYGVEFYNVVGTIEITDDVARRFVKLAVDALDDEGAVVATETTYNETAEALTAPGANAATLVTSGKVTPVLPGSRQRFRTSFLKDEHPTIARHRVRILDAPSAK